MLLERVLVLALLATHLAVVLVLAERHYNLIMINDKFIFNEAPSVQRVVKTKVTTNHIATKYLKRTLDQSTQGETLSQVDECI